MGGFLLGLVGGFLGAMVGAYVRALVDTRTYPFRYVCQEPGCFFKLSSNDPALLDAMASDHEQSSLHGQPPD